ncbi:MAG: ATP phosphoribosyltransferase regulatory subunit [Proteobacteria bacterium]|jgi:ATP phosphoribosyltransferase regulatory subunit|nr:ATP phosphoribosyltransferase regulatory subunit [Pseudomonadota bacterium]
MTDFISQKGLLPAGLSDVLYPGAEIQAKTIEKLLDVFSSYGYLRVKPPLVEYEDNLLLEGPGSLLKDSTFRIMDPLSQKMMALRSDMTAQISRISSTRMSHLPRPLRLSYSGDVLRVKGDSFNMDRQKTQVGAELIGVQSEIIDAEIILLCVKSLFSIGVSPITIDLNLPFLREYLLKEISISFRDEINEAIDRKDQNLIKKLKFKNSDLILDFMKASGDYNHSIKILSRLKLDNFAADARDYLLNVGKIIKENNSLVNISIDPLENRGFKYHTGLSFTLFSQNYRGEIAKGGRYQTISKETATGCTIYTEKLYNTSNDLIDRNLVYVPFFNIKIAEKIIKKGYKVIFGKNSNNNMELDAREIGCSYIWNNEAIEKIKN